MIKIRAMQTCVDRVTLKLLTLIQTINLLKLKPNYRNKFNKVGIITKHQLALTDRLIKVKLNRVTFFRKGNDPLTPIS